MDPSVFCIRFLIPINKVLIVRQFNKFRNFKKKFSTNIFIKHKTFKIFAILFNDNLNARTLNAIAKKNHYDVPHNFIKTLHNSFKIEGSKAQFNNIYNDVVCHKAQFKVFNILKRE